MVKIRLVRLGSKQTVFYRIVAIDKKRKRDGTSLDTIGYWYPSKSYKKIDEKKLKQWILTGASLTAGVKKLLEKK